MTSSAGTVFVVDDDPSMRKALGRLCQSAGLDVKLFGSAQELLTHGAIESPACIVLDVSMPGLSGLDLQGEIAARDIRTPIVFITGHGDIPMSVKAIKAGAVDFLTKPFASKVVLAVIRDAISKDAGLQASQTEQKTIERRLRSLTPREHQVFEMVIKGMLNKQIAAALGASEQTIKVHRHRMMAKMQVASVAALVQAAVKIGALKS